MATAVPSTPLTSRWTADDALAAAARLWFVVAVSGQWVFVSYVVSFYAIPTLSGHFADWARNTNLIKGYVAGDRVGNLYFGAHVMLAALITTSGALQLFPRLQVRAKAFHRWNGRLYVITALLMSIGGLWLIWVRGTYETLYGAASSSLLALSLMVCAGLAWRFAARRRIDRHRRWALRTFLLVNGVWFQRIGYMAWTILNHGVGIGDHMDGPFDIFWGFGSFLLPVAVLEIYLRTRDRGGVGARSVMAGSLLVLTVVMAVGIVGAYLDMWRPLMPRL